MKDILHRLIREIADLLPEFASNHEYAYLTQYTGLIERIVDACGELLLTERTSPTAAERAFLREMLHNPLLKPLQAKNDLEAWLLESAGTP